MQPDLFRTCLETTLLVFSRDGSDDEYSMCMDQAKVGIEVRIMAIKRAIVMPFLYGKTIRKMDQKVHMCNASLQYFSMFMIVGMHVLNLVRIQCIVFKMQTFKITWCMAYQAMCSTTLLNSSKRFIATRFDNFY